VETGPQESITLHVDRNNLSRWAQLSKVIRLTLFPILIIVSSVLLQSCAAPIVAIAASPTTAISLTTFLVTGKSPLEHATSAATEKDCSFFNIFTTKPICQEYFIPALIDRSELIIGETDQSNAIIEILEVRPSN
jgi:hypothetical protein